MASFVTPARFVDKATKCVKSEAWPACFVTPARFVNKRERKSLEARKIKATSFVYYSKDLSIFQKNCTQSDLLLLKFNDMHTAGAERL